MNVLWLCNIILPELASEFGLRKNVFGGWITGMKEVLDKDDSVNIVLCVPIKNPTYYKDGISGKTRYYSFPLLSEESNKTIEDQVDRFIEIINLEKPDIIHVWGTEYEHTYSMIKACEKLNIIEKVIVNIQGLISLCGKMYTMGIDNSYVERKINGKSIGDEKRDFLRRGEYEKYTIKKVKNVIGQTDWDCACVYDINPEVNYYYCGRIIRDSFYENAGKWSYDNCNKHQIFISNVAYPIKGIHNVIETLAKLKETYEDLNIVIAGTNLNNVENAYSKYILTMLENAKINDSIEWLGQISEEKMVDEYLKANVFLLSSLLENESNSISEAMMIGVPVVASYVGGVPNIVTNSETGYLYPLNEPYLLQYYIEKIFENPSLDAMLSKKGLEKAKIYLDKDSNRNTLLDIYYRVNSSEI